MPGAHFWQTESLPHLGTGVLAPRCGRLEPNPAYHAAKGSRHLDDRDAEQDGAQRAEQCDGRRNVFEERVLTKACSAAPTPEGTTNTILSIKVVRYASLCLPAAAISHTPVTTNSANAGQATQAKTRAAGDRRRRGPAQWFNKREKRNLAAHPDGRTEHTQGESHHVEVGYQGHFIQQCRIWWVRPGARTAECAG